MFRPSESDLKKPEMKPYLQELRKKHTVKEMADIMNVSASWMWKVLKSHHIEVEKKPKEKRIRKQRRYDREREQSDRTMMPLSAHLSTGCQQIVRGAWV